MNKVVQHIDVFTHVATWVTDQAVGAIVVVVRSVRCHRDDAFQSIDAGGRCRERQGSVVRRPNHADFASAPRGDHAFVSIDRSVPFRTAIQPIDHRFRGQRFIDSSNGRAALGKPGPWGRGMDNCKAARNPFPDMLTGQTRSLAHLRDLRGRFMFWWRAIEVLTGTPHVSGRRRTDTSIVGARLVDDGNFQAIGVGLLGASDAYVHPVQLAIVVGIELGFHE